MSKDYSSKSHWDEFVRQEYPALLAIAGRWTLDFHDLVHHTYLRCIHRPYPEKPMAYFAVAMFTEVTRGKFRQLYHFPEQYAGTPPTDEQDLNYLLRLEEVELYIDRLKWFDRQIIRLYLDGWRLTEVANGSGIDVGTLYQSLYRSKQILKDAVCNGTKEK